MSETTIQVSIAFSWPDGEAHDDDEPADEVEWSYKTGVPIPAVGDEVIFDPEDPPTEGVDHPIGQTNPRRRWLIGTVESRTFSFQTTKYERMAHDYVTVVLHMTGVRRL
jgi:hypothetical protein